MPLPKLAKKKITIREQEFEFTPLTMADLMEFQNLNKAVTDGDVQAMQELIKIVAERFTELTLEEFLELTADEFKTVMQEIAGTV